MINDQYAAGFFDGEGCVTACIRGGASRRKSPTILVCISNTHRDILQAHQDRWGGSLCERGGKHKAKVLTGRWQRQFQWTLSARRAGPFLRAIAPHVVVKRQVVDAALRYIDLQALPYRQRMDYTRLVERGGRKWPSPSVRPEFRAKIMTIHDEIKSLNIRSAPMNAIRGEKWAHWA